MPTYDYRCNSCGHTFETKQSMKDDKLVDCPECDKPELERLITNGNFQLKGKWFKTAGQY